MSEMKDWQVQFQHDTIPLGQLTLLPIETASKLEEDTPHKVIALQPLEPGRQKEIKSISNYFPIDNIPAFAHTLTAITQILHIDSQSMKAKLDASKIKTGSATLESAEALQTNRAKFEICFSRRWREHQSTIFLLVCQFTTPELKKKLKALLVNQRGLILQVLSNIEASGGYFSFAKVLRISYTRLQNLVILSSSAKMANLDSIGILKESLPAVSVFLVTFASRPNLEALTPSTLAQCSGHYLALPNSFKLAKYCKQQIIVWYYQQNQALVLEELLLSLSAILRRQRKVSGFFADFPFNHHQFNQKQFLLRLFSFYFNYISLDRMQGHNDEDIKGLVLEECTQQLLEQQQLVEERSKEREVHSFTTNRTPLHCPVCKKRSKITCLKCCDQFSTKFALCEVNCFEKFHQNRIVYAGEISGRRKINDFLIQDRAKEREESAEEKKVESADTPEVIHALTISEIKEKWRSTIEKERNRFQVFLKMSQMNFYPRKFVDRMAILSSQIQQISNKIIASKSMADKSG